MSAALEPSAAEPQPDRPHRVRGLWWKTLTGLWMAAAILAAFLGVGPDPKFNLGGHGAKIIFFHVPCAWLATMAYLVAASYAVACLVKFSKAGPRAAEPADRMTCAAMELGLLFSVLATVTGSIFSRNEWGMAWSWDPRQTSIVVIMLVFAAYIVLRGAIVDPDARSRLTAAYALVAAVPGLFLIWVLPRITETLHEGANQAVVRGGLSGGFRIVLLGFALPAFLGLFVWLLQLRGRALRVEAERTP